MDTIKKFIRLLFYMLLLFIVFIFILYITHSSTKYHCHGNQDSQLQNVFIRLNTLSPLTKLWSDNIGNITLEVPGETYQYFPYLNDARTMIFISNIDKKDSGTYYKLSNGLILNTDIGKFKGICKKIEE